MNGLLNICSITDGILMRMDNASTVLPLSDLAVNMPDEILKDAKKYIHDRQTGRLWVVGSNDTTADLIDASYKRFLKLMDDHLSISKFLFGEKPSSADFAIYGQLTQLIGLILHQENCLRYRIKACFLARCNG